MTPLRRWAGRLRRALHRANSWQALEGIPFHTGLGDSAWTLFGLVKSVKPEVCVEIGSARGWSTCLIALALRENGRGRLHAIDPHTNNDWSDRHSVNSRDALESNLDRVGVRDFVEVRQQYSTDAAKGWTAPIDLLFIDGDHSYEGVRRDWDLFSPFVSPFGIVLFHDTLWDLQPDAERGRGNIGVPRFVDELRREGYPVLTLSRDFGLTLVQPRRGGVPLLKS